MTMELTFYKPFSDDPMIPTGCDIAVKVMDSGQNMCEPLARKLHLLACQEAPQPAVEGKEFAPNIAYEFANGLVFCLRDMGLGEDQKVLEFLSKDESLAGQQKILPRIPRLLHSLGVEEQALIGLREALAAHSRRLR